MRLAYCLAVCLMQIISYANGGKYTIIAPGTIHPNEKYTVAVSVHQTAEPCQIKVGITGDFYNETKEVQVSENEVKNVEFDLPNFEKGHYNLTAEAVNCLENFKNTTELIYERFDNHLAIQTDKGIYQPGDEINFRVLVLDKDLRPAQALPDAVIWFEDGKRNRIKEIRNFETVKGVYTGKFKISQFPVTGGWNLGVTNGQTMRSVYFEVDKYVLPKYVVKVEATESVSVKDGDMQVIVRANYTYGKPLDGKATIILSLGANYYPEPRSSNNTENEKPPTLIKSTDMVNGKAKFDLSVKQYDVHLPNKNVPSYMEIVATVEEKFTGVKINASTYSHIYPYRYSANCLTYDSCSQFVSGEEKDVLLHITYVDGSTLKDTKSEVEIIYNSVLRKNWWQRSYISDENNTEMPTTTEAPVPENRKLSFKSHMNETGFANFKVSLPDLPEYDGYSHFYSLSMKYLDEQREIYNTYQYRPSTEKPVEQKEPTEYFKWQPKYGSDDELYLNKEAKFTLNSSEPLSYFVYNIIGRGNILKSGRIDLPDKPKEYQLSLTPEPSWASRFSIYAYYLDNEGNFKYAEQTYYVNYELQNQITVTAPEQVKPGEEVALKIQTTPNSFVGLTAIDKSSLLLMPNSDFHPRMFNWELLSYYTTTPTRFGYTYYPGSDSGCVTLTNADYVYKQIENENDVSSESLRTSMDRQDYSTTAAVPQSALAASVNHDVGASGAGGFAGASNVQVRKDFSETWLFDNIVNTETAEFTWSKKIPETITSWVLSAFSLHPEKGLGIAENKTEVTTFLPFFISIRLPYSVKRGEVINVPALVFNYMDKALDVEVTLENTDDEYDFAEFDNEIISDKKRSKNVRVPANGAAGASFLLKPKVIGNVMLKFTAISPVAGDAIHKSMKVVPEGITQYGNRAYFVNLHNEPQFKASFELELPEDLVPDSEHVEVGVMGDILGPVLNNLDNLVKLPRGCGEQITSTVLPNYLILKYLNGSKQLTPSMERKLISTLEDASQTIYRFRHSDGSFSSFGPSNKKDKPNHGSTWLTAYIVRTLIKLKEYVSVNDKYIQDGLSYLSQQQADNGTFTEKGDYFYSSQRSSVILTSTAVLAFMENSTNADKYAKEIGKGLEFIAQNIDKSDSLLAKSLGTYTLNKAQHATVQEKLDKLKSLAKTESDRMWWTQEKKQQHGDRWWYYVFSNDVETTSYALLTLLDQKSTTVDEVLPIIKWLVAQRNSYGGFVSTQDTVVGLSALLEFAEFADYKPAEMEVSISSGAKNENVELTKDNGILYQSVEMPSTAKSVDFVAKGTGAALVQIAYQYNIFEKDPHPSFTIKTTKIDNAGKSSRLEMEIRVNYVGEGDASNMAILEISTPSGYVIEEESLKEIRQLKRVSNTELKNSDSLLVVYFDHLYKNDEVVLMVEALRTHSVAMQRPSPIKLYDYYDTNKKVTAFYEVDSKLCDICENKDECPKC